MTINNDQTLVQLSPQEIKEAITQFILRDVQAACNVKKVTKSMKHNGYDIEVVFGYKSDAKGLLQEKITVPS